MAKPIAVQRQFSCPVEATLAIIGGKWKPIILFQLQTRTLRFGELRKAMPPGITQQMLTNQLRELEADGILTRTVYAEVPPRVEYSLTDLGQSLCPILEAMAVWGERVMTGGCRGKTLAAS
jgi:DNA-binding HxlR family transcriptional regulator